MAALRRSGIGLLLAVVLLAALANRGAYQGYFEDDDLDTLTWARLIPLQDLARNLPSLRYPPEHSRPTGYFYYGVLARTAGLQYPWWVAVLQLVHGINILLLWLLLRRLGLDAKASAVGCVFFALHRALFDAWWKPMFIYDLLCTTFALLSVLAYARRRWVVSFVAFWLAVRSKEVGIVVPAMLLCYEMFAGEGKWKRLIPFFVPAAIYGGYGLLYDLRHASATYGMRFGPAALWTSLAFYFSKILWIRYAGFLLLLVPVFVRDRRLYFGAGAMMSALCIYLLLPGRLLEIYLYLAMTGAAVVAGTLAARRPRIAALCVLAWIPWQWLLVQRQARRTVEAADERRAYVAALRGAPDSRVYVYDGAPASMHQWGVEGALRLFHEHVDSVRRLDEANLPVHAPMQLLVWDSGARRLFAAPFSPAKYSYLSAGAEAGPWQLVKGWLPGDGRYRPIQGQATARLYRPAAAVFAWEACAANPAELRTFVDGEELRKVQFREPGCASQRMPVRPGPPQIVSVDFLVLPAGEPVRIGGFGFEAP